MFSLLNYLKRCSYLVEDVVKFKLMATLLQDVCMNWELVNLRTRQVTCDIIRNTLHIVSSQEKQHSEVSPAVLNVIKSFLGAFGKESATRKSLSCSNTFFIEYERSSSVKEDILKIVTAYCKQFSSIELMHDALLCIQIGYVLLRSLDIHNLFSRRYDDPHHGIRAASAELLSVLNPFLTADINIESDNSIKLLEVSETLLLLDFTKFYIDCCYGYTAHWCFPPNTL